MTVRLSASGWPKIPDVSMKYPEGIPESDGHRPDSGYFGPITRAYIKAHEK